MTLFKEKSSRIFMDTKWLQPLSDPPSGKPLCRDTSLKLMADFLSDVFTTGQARNLFIFGKPGTGKTVCVQYLLSEINKYAKETKAPISAVYVNAGRTRTPYYTMLEIVKGSGLKVPDAGWQMFRLKMAFENTLRDKAVVIAIDEVDAILAKEKEPLVYYLNRQPKTTLILISNRIEDATQLPERALSTLQPKLISLDPYKPEEIKEILLDRVKHTFHSDVLPDNLLGEIARITSEAGDLRLGFSILLSAGYSAEKAGKARIEEEDVKSAIKGESKLDILKKMEALREQLQKLRKG